ncbi:polysaccharide deacetylase family protein [Chitinilyticum litopenaei]|uniref:polysaccharide deacetylase family protein n=1 Tax=Chitinilyticum litopenaei TaxID=1121276 RepID=UPI0004225B69|nr:polysaccharide deacetylase family protein [Chitinilyticum litopenaei]
MPRRLLPLLFAPLLLSPAAHATALAECLGYEAGARLITVNADDLGMHPDLDRAALALLDARQIQSVSIMPPAPNFAATARALAERKQAVGVHLTLTNEWQAAQGWGGVLPASAVPSLYNAQGRLWATTEEVGKHAKLDDVKQEIRAQIARVKAAGLRISHLDAHMLFWAARPDLLDFYFSLPRETGYPVITQIHREALAGQQKITAQLQREGVLTPDTYSMHYNPAQRVRGEPYPGYARLLAELPAGLNHIAIHPAEHSPAAERAIADLTLRLSDYDAWRNPAIQELLRKEKLQPVDLQGLQALQDKAKTGALPCLTRP